MNKTLKTLLVVLLIAIAIIIIVLALFGFVSKTHRPAFLYNFMKGGNEGYFMIFVSAGSNGTSYYGQIKYEGDDELILSNPGYIEITESTSDESDDSSPSVILRLMKDDFYAPMNELTIYKKNVIFIQQLSDDSPVVSAYKKISN